MLSFKSYLLLTLLMVVVLFQSCKKAPPTYDYNVLAQESAIADNYSNAVYVEIDKLAKDIATGLYKTDSSSVPKIITRSCETITITGIGWPKTVTVDYGAGCTDSATHITRKGQLTALFSGPYGGVSASVTITTTNYAQTAPDSTAFYQFSGKKVITHMDTTTTGHPIFTVLDGNATITKPDGKVIYWSTSRSHEWTQGYKTPNDITDDIYAITGWAQGTTTDGTYFRMDVADGRPLIKTLLCPYVCSGEVTYTVSGTQLANVIFAQTGNCGAGADTLHYNNSVFLFNVH